MTGNKNEIERAKEVQIQVRGAEILDQALQELQAREPDAVVQMDTLLIAILLARIGAQQERIQEELHCIRSRVDAM